MCCEREGEAEREREMNDAYKPIILELILDHLSHKFVAIAKWKRFDCSNAYQNEPNKWFTVSWNYIFWHHSKTTKMIYNRIPTHAYKQYRMPWMTEWMVRSRIVCVCVCVLALCEYVWHKANFKVRHISQCLRLWKSKRKTGNLCIKHFALFMCGITAKRCKG